MFVNTNVAALNAWLNLDNTQQNMNGVLQQLSSGLRINSAANDPSGLAISQQMQSQIDGMNQAYQNSQSGITLLQTADGAMGQVQNIMQSMYSLASEAATGTNNQTDLSALQSEMNQYAQEITQIANTTQFNNINLLDGTFQGKQIQIGANAGQALTMSMNAVDAYTLGVAGEQVNGVTGTNDTIGVVQASTTVNASGLAAATGSSYDYLSFEASPWQVSGATTGLTFASVSGTYSSAQTETIAMSVNAAGTGIAYTITYASGSTQTGTLSASSTSQTQTLTITDSSGDVLNFTTSTTLTASATNTFSVTPQSTTFYVTNSSTAATAAAVPSASSYILSSETFTGAIASGTYISLNSQSGATPAALVFQAGTGPSTTYAAALTFNASGASTFTTAGSFVANATGVTGTVIAAAATTDLYAFNVVTASAATGSGGNAQVATGLNIMTQGMANLALTSLQDAINQVSADRATVGAYQNRLQFASSQLQTSSQNLTTAQGGIMDTDVALQMANLTKDQILQQAGVAMLAQANAMPQALLKLFP